MNTNTLKLTYYQTDKFVNIGEIRLLRFANSTLSSMWALGNLEGEDIETT